MSAGSPTIVVPGAASVQSSIQGNNGVRHRTNSVSTTTTTATVEINGSGQVVMTNQGQYPSAKAVSLSVANLPQQTAAIPLIIGPQGAGSGASSGGVSISASTKYGSYQQQQPPTATLFNSINQAAVLSGAGGSGFQLGTSNGGSGSAGPGGSMPTITGGITRIVDSSGNILHLPSGTAAAAVNSGSATTFSTLVRVNGNGSGDNVTGT